MNITFATEADHEYIRDRDQHIPADLIPAKMNENEIYILRHEDGSNIGWMRYGYFWDNIPFMNLLWIDEPFRGQGTGAQVVRFWEEQMKQKGFNMVMTSTQADEGAQHFYRKLGYTDAGCLILDSQPLEILLTRKLDLTI
ncbi:GNAT family N-acetyltransferase [Paenibacillus camerounensis]|uniref:GNAT family N-acetyltransferase n=1 Tax=Paenibacillus camerounensis TaxID=1243663 RepID=UPI0005AB5B7A|nr:GNAT family N-acetyltransferase [Paenibacillus camerounensis]